MERSFSTADSDERYSFIQALSIVGVSFLFACTRLFGAPSPLAVILISVTSGLQAVFALCGGAIGAVASGSFDSAIPQITVMAVVAAFRLLFGHMQNNKAVTIISAALSGICVLASSIFSASSMSDIFIGVVLCVLTLVCSLSYTAGKRFLSRLNTYASASANSFDLISAGILFTVLTAALTSISIMPFNFGIMFSAAAVLYMTDCKKGYSSATGILSAVGIAAGSGGFSVCCLILAVSGLLAVLFERYSRLTRACAFIFITAAGVFFTGIDEYSAVYAVSVLASSLVCGLLPERFLPMRQNLYTTVNSLSEAPYKAFGRKLSVMSAAIGEMNDAISKTAKVLDKHDDRSLSQVYISACEQICRSCKNNMYCWGSRYNASADIMNKAVLNIKNGMLADETVLSGHFSDICSRRKELSQALNKQYAVFCSARSASRKITEMRGLLSAQLNASRKMLDSISDKLSAENICDTAAAEKTCELLKEYGLRDPAALVLTINERLTIDAYGYGYINGDTSSFHEKLSFVLRKGFDPPMISESGGQTHITVSERTPYDAQIRIFQKNKSGNRKNGDCCDCFNDGNGNVYLLLSDGMGSGSRARIDSAFACGMLSKMLKAGIDIEASMEMLNTSLLVKSSDESFATLDICRIDLCTGEISLYKAGGAETFVRCGKKFVKLEGNGIPFGVSIPASYTEKRFFVTEGDIVIMKSDGAELDQTWLEQLTMREKSADLDEIIDTAGEALKLSSEKGKEDDITIIGVKITK